MTLSPVFRWGFRYERQMRRKSIVLCLPSVGYAQAFPAVPAQQVLDALEWGSRSVPDENGGFLQVSGLSCEIHSYIPSGCTSDENGMCSGISGERRVKNVLVNGEPIDPAKTYTLASHNYMLLDNGDGCTAFDGAPILQDSVKLDNQVLMDYIIGTLGGVISEDYADAAFFTA